MFFILIFILIFVSFPIISVATGVASARGWINDGGQVVVPTTSVSNDYAVILGSSRADAEAA